MWIKFKFEATIGIGTTGGAHLIKNQVKFAIEVQKLDNALAICNTFGNNPKVKDTEININRPAGMDIYEKDLTIPAMDIVFINKDGNTESRSDHLVTNADIQSFIWAIKAGISMGKALMEK